MDVDSYLRFVLSLAIVVGLILLLGVALRRWGTRLGMPGVPVGRQRRLRVVEMASVDTRRRLVLVRRDDTEHLLLVGGLNDVVVEGGIHAPQDPPPDAGRSTTAAASNSFGALLRRQVGPEKGRAAGDDTHQ